MHYAATGRGYVCAAVCVCVCVRACVGSPCVRPAIAVGVALHRRRHQNTKTPYALAYIPTLPLTVGRRGAPLDIDCFSRLLHWISIASHNRLLLTGMALHWISIASHNRVQFRARRSAHQHKCGCSDRGSDRQDAGASHLPHPTRLKSLVEMHMLGILPVLPSTQRTARAIPTPSYPRHKASSTDCPIMP